MAGEAQQAVRGQIGAGQFAEALAGAEALLAADAGDHDALYMKAVCLRYLRRFEAGFAALQELKRLTPENGRAHQEEGHLLRDSGNQAAAVVAYRRACQCNPALTAAWKSLAAALEGQGREGEASQARAELTRLEQLPKPLLAAMDLIAQGKLLKAEDLVRQFLRKSPRHVEAMRLLADIGLKLGVLDDAEYLLESACEFEPDHVRARVDYIQALRKRQKFAKAKAEARRLLDAQPQNPSFQSLYAVEAMHSGDFQEALAMFGKVLERLPGDPSTLTSKGHACKTLGDFDGAVAAYREALASQPSHGEAYYSLANLKTYEFTPEETAAMQQQAASPSLAYMDRVYLAFAQGKAAEDKGDFEASFRHYAEGNQLKKAQSRYTSDAISREFDEQIAVCNAAFFKKRKGWGHQAPDPIFILGLPRAGSTLLEQILSSHSQVDGTLELPNILALASRLRRGQKISAASKYPAALPALKAADFARFGEDFIKDTRIHRQQAPFFIDKMPNNFRHIGLIHLMLPNAKIIDARRHPMACCFSAFRQLFAEGQEFSYALADLGAYYRDYVRLMAHWNQMLPGRILTVQHEEVVEDLEGQVRRLLTHCGLPFEPACLAYHETERAVRTPSSEQVRQPIFREGLDLWQDFEPWLAPLKEALGAEIRKAHKIG